MSKEEIAIFININNEIDKFVKNQKEVIFSFKSDHKTTDDEDNFLKALSHNLDNLIYWKNKILGLNLKESE